MKVRSSTVLRTERALTVSLSQAHPPTLSRRPSVARALPHLFVLLSVLYLGLLCVGSAPLSLLLGLLWVGCSGALLLARDYRWALRIERGRLYLLRNGVSVLDASVLPEGSQRLLLSDGRLEALRCRAGEAPSYIFGLPLLHLCTADLLRVKERLAAERQALESNSRQFELLDDPDVQSHLLSRLRAEEGNRPGGLRAALLSLSQGVSSRARAARALLSQSSLSPL